MRPGTLALAAAVTIGWAGWATAAPIASLSAALEAHHDVELVRRHHRGRGWGQWRLDRSGRDFGGDSGLGETTGRSSPEATRLERRRRGGWVDPPRDVQDPR